MEMHITGDIMRLRKDVREKKQALLDTINQNHTDYILERTKVYLQSYSKFLEACPNETVAKRMLDFQN